MKRQEFLDGPAVVSDASGHCRRGPATGVGQTRMGCAEIIDRPDQIHTMLKCQRVARQRTPAACQRGQTRTEGSVQSFDVRRIDDAVALRTPPERLYACRCAIDKAALGLDHPSSLVALDDLGDQDMAPRPQPVPSALPGVYGLAKGLSYGPNVRHQAIGTDQQGTTGRAALHPLDQPSDQGHVPLLADLAAQPQARLHHHGERHPHDATLFLHADLIGWDLPQVTGLFDHVLLYGLPLSPGAGPPIGNRPLIKPKSRHNGLHGTPMGKQGHDEGHGLCRSAQPIKHRAFGSAERLATLRTNEAPVFLRMDANVALADVASGRTRQIGAEYRGGVHDDSPLLVVLGSIPRKSMSGPPFPLQPHSTTV